MHHFPHVPGVELALLMLAELLRHGQCLAEDLLWGAVRYGFRSLPDAEAAVVLRRVLRSRFCPRRNIVMTKLVRDFSRASPAYTQTLRVLLGDRRLPLPAPYEPMGGYLFGILPLLRACAAGQAADLDRLLPAAAVDYALLDVLLRRAADPATRRRLALHGLQLMRLGGALAGPAKAALARQLEAGGLGRVQRLCGVLGKVPVVYRVAAAGGHPVPRDVLGLILAAVLDVSLDAAP